MVVGWARPAEMRATANISSSSLWELQVLAEERACVRDVEPLVVVLGPADGVAPPEATATAVLVWWMKCGDPESATQTPPLTSAASEFMSSFSQDP